MLTCVANFTTYICFSMFTEEGATIIDNKYRKKV